MPFLTDGRSLALVAHAALTTARDVLSVATWALLFCLVERLSRGRLTRDLFGVVLALAALHQS